LHLYIYSRYLTLFENISNIYKRALSRELASYIFHLQVLCRKYVQTHRTKSVTEQSRVHLSQCYSVIVDDHTKAYTLTR